jgi:hypothetical protein
MNLFKSSIQRAAVKMSLKRLRGVATRRMGTDNSARDEAMKPQSAKESGPGSVKDWAEAMKIKAPKKITSFIQRKLRY